MISKVEKEFLVDFVWQLLNQKKSCQIFNLFDDLSFCFATSQKHQIVDNSIIFEVFKSFIKKSKPLKQFFNRSFKCLSRQKMKNSFQFCLLQMILIFQMNPSNQ
jgi:hypothetical protein